MQIELTPNVGDAAMKLAQKYGLKGADCVQLASACETQQVRLQLGLPAMTFVSADDKLNTAAQAEGLAVENPEKRPPIP